jgi:hypothetical protein
MAVTVVAVGYVNTGDWHAKQNFLRPRVCPISRFVGHGSRGEREGNRAGDRTGRAAADRIDSRKQILQYGLPTAALGVPLRPEDALVNVAI